MSRAKNQGNIILHDVGNKMIDLYVHILAILFYFILGSGQISSLYYVNATEYDFNSLWYIPCTLSYYLNKLTILYILVHISLSFL